MSKTVQNETRKKLDLVVEALKENKGNSILSINLEKVDNAITSYFVICSGTSTTQVDGLFDSVQRKLKTEMKLNAYHIEGRNNCLWILMDYGDVIVHIFEEEQRSFYNLEELWADGQIERIEQE